MLKTEAQTVVGVTTIDQPAVPLVLVVPSVSLSAAGNQSPDHKNIFPHTRSALPRFNHAGGTGLDIETLGATNDELGRVAWTSVGTRSKIVWPGRPC